MHYCAYSFAELFQAAFQRPASPEENQEFTALNQNERNAKVRELAEIAKWQTEEVTTAEGLFVAFWPPR